MGQINRIGHRPAFFPKKGVKGAQETHAPQKSQNSPDRKKELETLSRGNAKVAIAHQIKDFAHIKKAVDQAPEIDQSKRIADLKQKIQSGQYKIDAGALADKIMASEF